MSSDGGAKPVAVRYQLSEGNELRLQVGKDEIVIELSDVAEVFGTQLSANKRYTLPPGPATISFIP